MLAGAVVASACFVAAPASADNCELLWDQRCCPIPGNPQTGIAENMLIICNCTDIDAEYDWFLKTTEPGVVFDPPGGVVTLAPGECIEIPIKIYCPIDSATGSDGFLFQANVVNLTTGGQFSCQGSVVNVGDAKITPPDPVIDVPITGTTSTAVNVQNIGSSGKDGVFDIEVMVMGDGSATPEWVNPVRVSPTEIVALNLRLEGPEQGRRGFDQFFDVIFLIDTDGDGVGEAVSALKAQLVGGPCIGDLDGDGVVGSADLAELIGRWGPCP